MKRLAARLLLIVLGAVLIAGAGLMAWQLRERRTTYFTDADSIRAKTDEAIVRDVMWEPAGLIDGTVNTRADEFTPRLTADGTTLLIVRGRPGQNADIYACRRTAEGWGDPEPLTAINSEADELDPEPSPDGLWLFFHSNRAGGLGGYDLWVSRRGPDGWMKPHNLGPDVNTPYHEYGPSLTPDGSGMYFSSNRPGAGETVDPDMAATEVQRDGADRDYDIYIATVSADVVVGPEPVDVLNTRYDEGSPAVSPSGDFVYFTTNRPGGLGGFDIYRARRVMGELRPPSNVGEAINTEADELDPACGLGGFALHFSSNRPRELADGRFVNDFDLHFAKSKEVFRQSEVYRAELDWRKLWETLGPFLFWLVLTVLVILSLVRLQRAELRRLTLIARCLLVSLLVHMLIMLVLSFWQVTTTLQGLMKERGGTQVVLTSTAVGSRLAGQVRGNLTQVEATDAATDPSPRQAAELPTESPATEATVAMEPTSVQTQAKPLASADVPDAPTEPTPAPAVAAAAPMPDPIALPLEMPIQASAASVAEAAPAAPTAAINDTRLESEASDALPSQSQPVDAAVTLDVPRIDTAVSGGSTVPFAQPLPLQDTSAPVPDLARPMPAPPAPAFAEATNFVLPTDAAPAETATAAAQQPVTRPGPTAESSDRQVASVLSPAVLDPTVSVTAPGRPDSLEVAAPALDLAAADPTQAASAPNVDQAPPDPMPVAEAGAMDLALPDTIEVATAIEPSGDASTPVVADAEPASRAEVPLASNDLAEAVEIEVGAIDAPLSDDLTFAARPTERSPSAEDRWSDALVAIDVGDAPSATSDSALPAMEESMAAEAADVTEMPAALAAEADRAAMDELALMDDPPLPDTAIALFPRLMEPVLDAAVLVEPKDDESEPELLGPVEVPQIDFSDSVEAEPDMMALDMPPAPSTPYSQRAPEVREKLLEERGGSRETERAVSMALAWLARHQSPDGRWSGRQFDDSCGRCGGPAKVNSDIALTGLTLLCFFAADHAHHRPGPYQDNVRRGLLWLASRQDRFGDLTGLESMYSHGIASMALAEAYGMSGDPSLAGPVRAAVDFIYRARNRRVGGWRYDPGQAGDTSVTGWQIMALTSAKRAGLDVPEEGFDVARRWMLKVRDSWNPALYSYQPKRRPTPAMTAEGMFIHQMIGSDPVEVHMADSAEYLTDNLPNWSVDANSYYWYYATLALFQYGGEPWAKWNETIKEQLIEHQVGEGNAAGSWNPDGKWANVGGRVYQTALCTLTLEVYYRYLPLYVSEATAAVEP